MKNTHVQHDSKHDCMVSEIEYSLPSSSSAMQQKSSRNFSIDLSGGRRSSSPSSVSIASNGVGSGAWKKTKIRLLPFVTPRQTLSQRNTQRPPSSLATTKTAISNNSSYKSSQVVVPASMSDFLDRENEILGGEFSSTQGLPSGLGTSDNIDFDRAASAFPDIGLDGTEDIPPPSVPAQKPSNTFSFDDFIDTKPTPNVRVTGDDEIEKFEDQFPEIVTTTPAFPSIPAQQPSFASPIAPRPQPSAFTSTPILQQPLADEEEPEVIRQWREKQAAGVKSREEAAAARRQETITKAERSIDQFYEEYAVKKERNIKENKQQEADYLSSLSDSLSNGTTWSRICDLVELQNSQSKTLARNGTGTTDLSRFKEVLLRLKREGDTAPGAAGY